MPDTPHPYGSLMRCVESMRASQAKYFRDRSPAALRDARAMEARVDALIANFFKNFPEEKSHPPPTAKRPFRMKYNQFFAAFAASQAAGNPLSREEQISEFTGGRTTSLKELSVGELGELTRRLNSMSGFSVKNPHHGDKADKMRKSIIAIFHKMKRPPAAAIAWAEKQGVKGIKKPFNEYSTGELFVLIRVAEKALADYQLAIRKSIAP